MKEMRKHMAWYLKGLPRCGAGEGRIMEQTSRDGWAHLTNMSIRYEDANRTPDS